jgi:hypothetical protein
MSRHVKRLLTPKKEATAGDLTRRNTIWTSAMNATGWVRPLQEVKYEAAIQEDASTQPPKRI